MAPESLIIIAGLIIPVTTILALCPSMRVPQHKPREWEWRSFWKILNLYDPEPIALMHAIYFLFWGTWILIVQNSTTTALSAAFNLVPLAIIMVGIGGLTIVSMALDMHRTYCACLAMTLAVFAVLGWSAGLRSEFKAVGVVAYFIPCLAESWVLWRLNHDDLQLRVKGLV